MLKKKTIGLTHTHTHKNPTGLIPHTHTHTQDQQASAILTKPGNFTFLKPGFGWGGVGGVFLKNKQKKCFNKLK